MCRVISFRCVLYFLRAVSVGHMASMLVRAYTTEEVVSDRSLLVFFFHPCFRERTYSRISNAFMRVSVLFSFNVYTFLNRFSLRRVYLCPRRPCPPSRYRARPGTGPRSRTRSLPGTKSCFFNVSPPARSHARAHACP